MNLLSTEPLLKYFFFKLPNLQRNKQKDKKERKNKFCYHQRI